jgi:hypothetical protein
MRGVLATFVLAGGLLVGRAHSQNLQPQDDIQSWNDIQLTVPIDENFELFSALTGRFGKNITRLNDGRAAIGIGWKANKLLTIIPFYWFIRARNSNSLFRNEHRLNVRATLRFPLGKFGGVHRSTYEYRIREPLNSWRYRALLGIERDIPKSIIPSAKWFVNDEIFYDSILDRFSRNRFSIGINKTLSKMLSVDIYYMRQNDGFSRPGDLHTIWATWRVKL